MALPKVRTEFINHDKWIFIPTKIWSRDVNLPIFHDENILLALVSQPVERIFSVHCYCYGNCVY